MVKADAYGTDAATLSHFYTKHCDIDIIGVSHISEAIHLRSKGVEAAIFVIHVSPSEIDALSEYNLEVGISDHALYNHLCKTETPIKVHLNINTGMHRFGCSPEEALSLARTISSSPSLHLEGVMTHFAAANSIEHDPFSYEQQEVFAKLLDQLKAENLLPPWIHVANSSGALRFPMPFCTMVRIGLLPFGLYTSSQEKKHLLLNPALSLQTNICHIRVGMKGETISYGRNYRLEKDHTIIGILPIGYHDGLHRHYSNNAHVVVHGKKAPIVGTICMDYSMIDLTNIVEAKIGDRVEIFGKTTHAEEFASFGQTDVHELVACLGPRIKREFINSNLN